MTSAPGLPPATGARLDAGAGAPPAPARLRRRRCRRRAWSAATWPAMRGSRGCCSPGCRRCVRVNVRGSNAGVWLEASVRYALAEARSPRPGGAGVLAKLAEVLFIEVLRLYMNEQSDGPHRLAGRRGRPHRRRRVERAARASRARLDAGGTGARGRHVAVGARRALPAAGRQLADAVPDAVAHAARGQPAVAAATRRSRASPRTSATRPTPRSAARSGASTARRRRRGASGRRPAKSAR